MALGNADIQFVSTLIHEYLYAAPSMLSVVRDRSLELVGGDNLRIDDFNTTITIGDIPDNSVADIAYQDLDDRSVALDLDKRKYFGIRVPDSAIMEKLYDVLNDGARQAGNTLRNQIDKDLITAHTANADTSLGTQSHTETIKTVGNKTNSIPEWNSPEFRELLVNLIADRQVVASRNAWPETGWYMAMAPEIRGQLVKFLIDKGNLGTGVLGDRAFVDAAIGGVLGFTPIVSHNLTGDGTDAGSDQFPIHFGITGDTLHYANQYSLVERMRAESFFGDFVRGATRYGARVRENNRRMRVRFTLED